jgi:hypothetical protein
LQPLFVGYLPATLNYVVAVLNFIHEKVVPILQTEKYNQPNLWEPLATSVISGVLVCITLNLFLKTTVHPFVPQDYLENHPSSQSLDLSVVHWIDVPRPEKSREAVASALHPTLCAMYFCDDSGLLSSFDGNLLSYVKSIQFE